MRGLAIVGLVMVGLALVLMVYLFWLAL